MKKIYVSLDIGSDSVRFVVGELLNDKMFILASSKVKTNGVRKGLIVDANEVINSIKEGIALTEKRLGFKIKKVIVNVPSFNAKYIYVTSNITVDNKEKIVTSHEVNELIKKSVYSKIDKDYELVTVIPLDFIIDGNKNNSYPIGKKAKKMEFKGIMITVPAKNVYSVMSVVESAGLEVFDITLSGVSDYAEVRDNNLDKRVGAIVNLGHELTTVSIINKGKFMNTNVIPVGGRNIERDLEYFFKIDETEARMLKERFAACHKRFSGSNENIDIKDINNNTIKLNGLEVSEVIEERMTEMLKLAKEEIALLSKQPVNYIILTGGLTEIKAFKHLAFDIFEKDAIIYSIDTLGVRESEYITALGMIKYLANKMQMRGKYHPMIDEEDEIIPTTSSASNVKTETKLSIPKIFTNFLSSNKEDK